MATMQLATIGFASDSDVGEADPEELHFQQVKVTIHEELVDSLELSLLTHLDDEGMRAQVRAVAEELCRERAALLNGLDRSRMLDELLDEVFGLGPLEPLLKDGSVTDVLVNRAHEVYIERNGRLEFTNVVFADDQHLMRIIQRVVSRVGRRIDEVSPLVDARLEDGSRVNAVVPPLALNGPTLSIRRFGTNPLEIDDLVERNALTEDMVAFLAGAIDARMSFLISGGTGAGKTTLLNALTRFIPRDERLVTIEDSAELIVQHRHVIRLETRTANTEGAGEIGPRELVKNSLRMRPDRIIVGEVRGPEALDMLQAMNTGHEGSLTTIHANDTRDALSRLEVMVAMAGYELPIAVVRQYIASGIRLIVHMARLKGGVRRITRISEILDAEDGTVRVQDIFGFRQDSVDKQGRAVGCFYTTGHRPKCLERMRAAGIELDDRMFEAREFPAE